MTAFVPEFQGHPDPIGAQLERWQEQGRPITPWVRHAMRAWAQRDSVIPPVGKKASRVTNLEAGFLPILCNCTECKGAALIFPPEVGMPEPNNGICICQRCSFNGSAGERKAAMP